MYSKDHFIKARHSVLNVALPLDSFLSGPLTYSTKAAAEPLNLVFKIFK